MADSHDIAHIISIIAIICATSLLALGRVIPTPKTSRYSAAYGLHLEYPLHEENENALGQEDNKEMTECVLMNVQRRVFSQLNGYQYCIRAWPWSGSQLDMAARGRVLDH